MKKITLYFFTLCCLIACQDKKAVETEQIAVEETTYLNASKEDSLYIHFEIEYPTSLENNNVLVPIQQSLVTNLFGEPYAHTSIHDAIQQVLTTYQTEYIRNNEILIDELETSNEDSEEHEIAHWSFSEEEILTGRIMNVENNILSYGIEQYVYTGGAHGVSNRYFYNYDLQTGDLLTEEDIFVTNYQETLTSLLRQNLVAQNPETQVIEDLAQTEYDVEKIVPNNNFYFTPEGIIYVFNPYEIAPYAYGETEIFILKGDLKSILKPTK